MKLFGKAVQLGIALTLVIPSEVGAQHFPPDEDLRLMLRYMVEDGVAPGIVVGLVEADGSTRMLSYGTGGPDTRSLSPRSVFDLGSINKTFTGTLLADMVARGEVDLLDPVGDYLPDTVSVPSYGDREITLLDLATHTSGLSRLPENYRPPDMRDPYAAYTVEILYAFLSSHDLRREPGSEYEYSNLGFGLLGHALARAAGMSYRDLLRERILGPLQMEQTGYGFDGEMTGWTVWGHKYGKPVPYWGGTEAIDGAGGLRSSLADMLLYLKANMGPPETPLETAMQMAQESRGTRGEGGPEYGLSWAIGLFPGRSPMKMHSGGTGGFSTRIAFVPDKHIGIVSLANAFDADTNLEDLLVFDPPPEDWGDRRIDVETLARYAGEYRSSSGGSVYYVRLEAEGYLTYQPRGRSRARLYAKSDTTFYQLQGPWSLTFRVSGAEEPAELWMEVDEREPGLEIQRSSRKVGNRTPPPAVAAGNAGALVAFAGFAEPIAWTIYGWGPVGWVLLGLVLVVGAGGFAWRLLRWRRRRKTQGA